MTHPEKTSLYLLAAKLSTIVSKLTTVMTLWLSPLLLLAIRLQIADVFFPSGRVKIADWDATIYLFQTEYQVPVLSPELAATLAATFELTMPVLLVLGLASRLAVLPLFAMAIVIQFVLGASNPSYDSTEHFYWMFLLATIFVFGAGKISLDHAIASYLMKRQAPGNLQRPELRRDQ